MFQRFVFVFLQKKAAYNVEKNQTDAIVIHNSELSGKDKNMVRLGDIVFTGISFKGTETDLIRYACRELQKYLLRITGKKLEVFDTADRPAHCFLLEMSAEGYTTNGYDRIRIFPQDGNLILRGENPVSVLYAVYDFLKEFANAAFYAPGKDFEYLEEMEDLCLDEKRFPFEKSSTVAIRDFVNRTNSGEVLSFAVKNRINSILGCGPWLDGSDKCNKVNAALIHSFGLKIRGPGHSWKHFVPDASLFETHSEYFPMVDGKRVVNNRTCCFSNPEVRKIFMDKLRAYLKLHPYWDIFAFWAEDIPDMRYCDCEECRKKSTADWYVLLCNEAAKILHEELPDAIFEMIAYRGTALPPDEPKAFFRNGEKMLIDFCVNYSRDLYHPMETAVNANKDLCELYSKWRNFLKQSSYHGKMMLMEYYNLCELPNSGPCGRTLLWPLDVIRKDIQYYLREGIEALGAFTGFDRLAFPTPLRLWTFIQLWSDPELDLEKVKKEFYCRYFGEKTFPQVMKYIECFEQEMFREVSPENIQELKDCLALLSGLDGERVEILRIHHEYAVLVKEVFYHWTQNNKKEYEEAEKQWRSFPERHARLLSAYTAPFPLMWYEHWCGGKIGYDRNGNWIEFTDDKKKMWL